LAWKASNSNFADRRQSEARNFETAQHIDKQKCLSNALHNGIKLGGIIPRGSGVT